MVVSAFSDLDQLIAKIRFTFAHAGRGGFITVAYFNDLNLEPSQIYSPEDMMVARLIHRGLLQTDRSGQIQPDLCTDYEIRDLTYTFYLNPVAKFHNGKPVSSADIVYSLEQLARAPRLTNASCFVMEINGADNYRSGLKNEIDGLFVIDDTTIAITLRRPFPAFEDYLAGPGGYIVPVPGYVSSGANIIGAGPYRMKYSDPGGLVVELASADDPGAYLDSIKFVHFASPEEAGLAYELGKLDLFPALGEPPPKFVGKGNNSSQNLETNAYVILGIDNRRSYQAGQDFGKALSFLLDRSSIIRVILGGSGAKPNITISQQEKMTYPLYDPYAPDSASYYLSQVILLPKNLNLYIDSSFPVLGKVARYIEGQLQYRGIKITEKKLDFSLPLDDSKTDADIDLYLTTYLPAGDNPDCMLYPMLSAKSVERNQFSLLHR